MDQNTKTLASALIGLGGLVLTFPPSKSDQAAHEGCSTAPLQIQLDTLSPLQLTRDL